MYTLLRYGVGGLLYTFLLGVLFDSINPASWPKSAVGFELAGCLLVFAVIMGFDVYKDELRQRQEAKEREEATAKTEMEKFLAELHSKEKLELGKHRLALAAQHGTGVVNDKSSLADSPVLLAQQAK